MTPRWDALETVDGEGNGRRRRREEEVSAKMPFFFSRATPTFLDFRSPSASRPTPPTVPRFSPVDSVSFLPRFPSIPASAVPTRLGHAMETTSRRSSLAGFYAKPAVQVVRPPLSSRSGEKLV